MPITLIGETHHEKFDEDFVLDAKKLATTGEIILFLENEVYSKYTNGNISPYVYATEDKLIWEYMGIILALTEIYPIIHPTELDRKTYLQLHNEMESIYSSLNNDNKELFNNIKNRVTDCLEEYIKSYISFLANTKESNPVSKLLINLLDEVVNMNCLNCNSSKNPLQVAMEIMYEARKSEADYTPSKIHVRFFHDNLDFFNAVLRIAADLFCEYIHNGQYSEAIKNHPGIKKPWLDNYFNYKCIRVSNKTLLNHDLVVVDLRNQVFIERIQEMASKTDKDIWLIIGEAHLEGLKTLFSSQAPLLSVKVIQRDDKAKLLATYSNLLDRQSATSRLVI